jgi:hypothetical protein
MAFGFQCNNGWFRLLWDLSQGLEKLITEQYERRSSQMPYVAQVKEKFGTLRFYMDGNTTPEMEKLIAEAEAKSEITCEDCGGSGRCRSIGGWMTTICDACDSERRLRDPEEW